VCERLRAPRIPIEKRRKKLTPYISIYLRRFVSVLSRIAWENHPITLV